MRLRERVTPRPRCTSAPRASVVRLPLSWTVAVASSGGSSTKRRVAGPVPRGPQVTSW